MAYWPTLHAGCLWLTGPRYSLAVCGSLAHAIGWLFVAHWATVQVGCLWLTGPRKGWMFVAHWLMLQAGYLWLTGPRYRLAVCGALGHGTGWLFVAHWLMLQAGCLWLIGPCYRLAVCGSLGHATGWLFLTGPPYWKTSDLLSETDPFPETSCLKEAKKPGNVNILLMISLSAAT